MLIPYTWLRCAKCRRNFGMASFGPTIAPPYITCPRCGIENRLAPGVTEWRYMSPLSRFFVRAKYGLFGTLIGTFGVTLVSVITSPNPAIITSWPEGLGAIVGFMLGVTLWVQGEIAASNERLADKHYDAKVGAFSGAR